MHWIFKIGRNIQMWEIKTILFIVIGNTLFKHNCINVIIKEKIFWRCKRILWI